MRELIEKTVDGEVYSFSQFGAKKSLRMLIKISKIVGKPLSLAFASAEGPGKLSDKTVNPNTLAQAVEALMERMDEDEVISILESLTSGDACLCNGKKVDFNGHYEGNLSHMFKVLKAALEVQYGNFFDALSEYLSLGTPGMAGVSTRVQ